MSPILGLTDKQSATPRLPVLGQLRKGEPRPESGNRPGKDTDHFRFTSDDPEVLAAFEQAYGQGPQTLSPVYLPYHSVKDNFPTWREKWVRGGLVHRCDGETVSIWFDPKRLVYIRDPRVDGRPMACPGGCSKRGRLYLVLPGLIAAGHVGLVMLSTGSTHDILAIQGGMLVVGAQATLVGVGLTLRRTETEITAVQEVQGVRKRVRRKYWRVELVPDPAWMRVKLEQGRRAALGRPAGPTVDEETGQVIEGTWSESKAPQSEPESGSESPAVESTEGEKKNDAEKTQGKKPKLTRPLSLETLKEALETKAKGYGLGPASDGKQNVVAGKLNAVAQMASGSKSREVHTRLRKQFMRAVLGFDTVRKLVEGYCDALLDWAMAGGGEPDPMAVREFALIIEGLEAETGQAGLAGLDDQPGVEPIPVGEPTGAEDEEEDLLF